MQVPVDPVAKDRAVDGNDDIRMFDSYVFYVWSVDRCTPGMYAPRGFRGSIRHCLIAILLLGHAASDARAGSYLDATELFAIGAVSGGVLQLGNHLKTIPEGRGPRFTGHLPFEESFQRWLGGTCKVGKQNFLDDSFGSFITPAIGAVVLTGVNIAYPYDTRGKDASQDLFLYLTGLVATKGISNITKGTIARERPFVCILKDSVDTKSEYGSSYSQHSFFSGHASSAFFATGYLNLRIRSSMRQRMSPDRYDDWKWVSSSMLYGWATVVALSRVHAYKHHLFDVMAGAAAGMLLSELFYNLPKDPDTANASSTPIPVRIVFRF